MFVASSPSWLPWVADKLAGWIFGKAVGDLLFGALHKLSFFSKSPRKRNELSQFDKKLRNELINELSDCQKEIHRAMNITFRNNEEEINLRLDHTRNRISNLIRNASTVASLNASGHALSDLRIYKTINLIMMVSSFATKENAIDVLHSIEKGDKKNTELHLDELDEHARGLESLWHLRTTSLTAPMALPQILYMFEEKHPTLFNSIWGSNILLLFLEEGKARGKISETMLIPVSQRLYEKKGALVGLDEYYFEFKKIFPETDISIVKLEELIRSLVSRGVIGGIEMIGNYKTVLIKPIELTGDLNEVLNIVSQREELRSGGLSIEEVMLETNWSEEYAMRVLELAERKEITRKVESLLEGDQYYFPALMGVE